MRARRLWRSWRDWRRSRPFWGGLLVIAGGAEILATTAASLGVTLRVGPAGTGTFAGTVITMILVVSGLLLWFSPAQRVFYSIVAVILSLATFNTINLGGFFAGMLLGILGGALGFAWTRDPSRPAVPVRPGEPARLGEPQPGFSLSGEPPPGEPPPGGPPPGGPLPGGLLPGQAARPVNSSRPGRGEAGAPGRLLSLGALPLALLIVAGSAQWQAHSRARDPLARRLLAACPWAGCSSAGRALAARALVVAAVPSELTAGAAKLSGLAYDGVVSVPRASGPPLRMMKFTLTSATLTGRPRLAVHGTEGTVVITASTISFAGHVVLYTTKFSADLAGTRLTLTPDSPAALVTRLLGGLVAGHLAAGGIVADHPLAVAGTSDLTGLTLSVR